MRGRGVECGGERGDGAAGGQTIDPTEFQPKDTLSEQRAFRKKALISLLVQVILGTLLVVFARVDFMRIFGALLLIISIATGFGLLFRMDDAPWRK
jgi:hypothetical protein